MCGGNKEEYAKYSPLLSTMGTNVMYFGESGSGTAAKLVNQCLVTAHAQAAAEAIHMAESFNLIDLGTRKPESNKNTSIEKEQRLIEMLTSSWGQSKVLELLLNDYITIKTAEGGSAARCPSEMAPPSGAPLRNLDKDMQCAMGDIRTILTDRNKRRHSVEERDDSCREAGNSIFSTAAGTAGTAGTAAGFAGRSQDEGREEEEEEEAESMLSREFPLFSQSAAQVAAACAVPQKRSSAASAGGNLSHGPFLSLIELLRPPPAPPVVR
jgi:hypothetical protein